MKNFLERFPEFDQVDVKLLTRVIDESKVELNQKVWGQLYETGWQFLAADKLARAPMGEPARLDATSNKTTYGLEFERLCRISAMGARVA